MFAKLAQLGHFGRPQSAGPSARPCNDNHVLRLVVSRQSGRARLTCRWQKKPNGTFECFWVTEGADATGIAEEPQLCPSNRLPLRALLAT